MPATRTNELPGGMVLLPEKDLLSSPVQAALTRKKNKTAEKENVPQPTGEGRQLRSQKDNNRKAFDQDMDQALLDYQRT